MFRQYERNNMKHNKRVILRVSLFIFFGIIFGKNISKENSILSVQGSYSINVDNIYELVGDVDYVFEGKVKSEKETIYKNPVEKEERNGKISIIATPYTVYEVENIENIKGNLRVGENIPIQKAGGYSKDKRDILLYDGDELPIVGESYYFFAYAQPDGSILVSGKNSNIKIDEETYSLKREKMIDAVTNQIGSKRKRFVSDFEQ